MGFFLRRNSKQTTKLKALLKLALSRLAVTRRPRHGRRAIARGDVGHLLALGHLDRALARAEQVIQEDNMLEVFDVIELYCNLLIAQAEQLDKPKDCGEEVKKAAAGLMFAAARCGDLPELLDARAILSDKFGNDFAKPAKEGAGCVDPMLVRKLSGRSTSTELIKKLTKEIGEENNILLDYPVAANEIKQGGQTQETENMPAKEFAKESTVKMETFYEGKQGLVEGGNTKARRTQPPSRPPPPVPVREPANPSLAQLSKDERVLRESMKYRNARAAAEAAAESASYAARAARVAAELSRPQSKGKGGGSQDKAHPFQMAAVEQDAPSSKLNKSPPPSPSWSGKSTVTSVGSEPPHKGKEVAFDETYEEWDEVEDVLRSPPPRGPFHRRTASAMEGGSTRNGTSAPYVRPPYRRNATTSNGSNGSIARREGPDDNPPSQDGGVYESSANVHPPYRRIVSALEGSNERIALHEEVRKIGTDGRLLQERVYGGASSSDAPARLNPERRAISVRTRR